MGQPTLTGEEWSPEDELELMVAKLKYLLKISLDMDEEDIEIILDNDEYWKERKDKL